MTIPYFSGTTVAYLPLQNVTDNYRKIIKSASSIDAASVLPDDVDPTVLAGYEAQRSLTLDLYASAHATVHEVRHPNGCEGDDLSKHLLTYQLLKVAWAGGNTISIATLKPLSRGTIAINTTDPSEPPVFDYRTFSDPTDLDIAVASLKKTRDWTDSGPMQEIGAVETYPGRNVSSNREIAAAIRNFATSTWAHPTSSCSMLKRELGGVVDSELRVYGVKGLRVVDASIMPMIIGSHTSSTVYAVAEKVSL
jgi:choline dehydrogenase-like flavoprotein